MHIEIRRNAEISLTKQIYLSIIDHIRSGLLQEELQLPSVRDLSQLEQEGFITSV
jgi:DNA-binding transcriptional regulator YhcF (GntR family)